ncbi:MAG: hypothetical protein U0271_21430 [Polyangiaceae bacterium]
MTFSNQLGAKGTLLSATVALFLGSLFIACGGGADIGEACETRGSTDECTDNAVCDQNANGETVCLELCTSQDDCDTDESCDGVSGGSLKACHPKP